MPRRYKATLPDWRAAASHEISRRNGRRVADYPGHDWRGERMAGATPAAAAERAILGTPAAPPDPAAAATLLAEVKALIEAAWACPPRRPTEAGWAAVRRALDLFGLANVLAGASYAEKVVSVYDEFRVRLRLHLCRHLRTGQAVEPGTVTGFAAGGNVLIRPKEGGAARQFNPCSCRAACWQEWERLRPVWPGPPGADPARREETGPVSEEDVPC